MKSCRREFIVTPETAIKFTEVSILLTCIFAPPRANKLRLFLFRIIMITLVLLTFTFFLALVLAIIENLDKLVVVVKSLTFISSLVNYITKVVIVRIYCEKFKKLQLTIKNFIANADKFERKILQKYVNKCWKFQLFVTIGSYFTTTMFLLGPLILPQKFPTAAAYPFSTENSIVAVMVYLQQSIGGYLAASAVVLDCQMAVYLWYLCARFEGLILQMNYVEDQDQLRQFIKKHQFLLLFINETIPSIRAVVFSTVTINKFIMTCAAVILISDEAFIEKFQCAVIVVFTALNVYTFIRPADRLIQLTSCGMSSKVFYTLLTLNQEMKKTCLLIIHKTQYPVLIRIPGFLDAVSNQYYSSPTLCSSIVSMETSTRRHGSKNGGFKVNPETAVSFTKLNVCMTCIWVPKGRLNLILFETFLWFLIFLSLGLFFPLIVTVMRFIDNTFVVMKSFILIVRTVNYIIKVIVCRIYQDELQELGRSLNDFIRNASPNDKLYLEKYVNKCWIFHGYMTCSYYLTTTVVLMGPLVLPDKFPSDAVYPFSVDHPVVATIIYAHQCIFGYQCSAGMTLDCQAALFLWYLCARFEILISEIENVSSLKDMGVIVRTHQEILRFADRVIRPIRLIVLTTVTMTKIGMISGGLVLISDEPITIKSSKTISEKIFSTAATHPPIIRKLWLSVIHRTQKPITINIPGFLETLSNEYYANFLSTAFSVFTAMHTVVS